METLEKDFLTQLSQYNAMIHKLCRLYRDSVEDREDLFQEIVFQLWKSYPNYKGDAKISTWMYRIATNECITFLNKKKQKNNVPLDEVDYELSNNFGESTQFTGDQIQRKLQQALLTLPEKQKLVFNMKYYDDMKYEEISQVLGTSVGALKASFHLAVKKIEAYLLTED